MEVKNCRKCGRMFNYVFGPIVCPKCKDSFEEKFQEVKKFVQENGHASMIEVCKNCNVEADQVRQWIREERLQFADDSPIKISCERCGAMIGFGKFCDKCKVELNKELNSITKANKVETSVIKTPVDSRSRMRYLH